MVKRWIDEWIVRIEDITEDVRRIHALIENEGSQGVEKVVEELNGREVAGGCPAAWRRTRDGSWDARGRGVKR
jgi:hypothetical protein